jgi:hypothetical protein
MASSEELKMSRSPDQVRAEIARARQQIATSIVELRREVAQSADWRAWVRRNPMLFLSGAFVLGFVLGSRRSRQT